MVMYANKGETKEKYKLPEIKSKLQHISSFSLTISMLFLIFFSLRMRGRHLRGEGKGKPRNPSLHTLLNACYAGYFSLDNDGHEGRHWVFLILLSQHKFLLNLMNHQKAFIAYPDLKRPLH